MTTRHYPVLFAGCAIEDLPYAEAVQQRLERHAEVEIWNEGSFVPSGNALQSLLASGRRVDFALLIASSLDTLSTRGESWNVMRDNVLFELGIFLGALGPERTFLLINRALSPHIPTDLGGVTPLTFDSRKLNPQSVVGAACTDIQKAISTHGLKGASNV